MFAILKQMKESSSGSNKVPHQPALSYSYFQEKDT